MRMLNKEITIFDFLPLIFCVFGDVTSLKPPFGKHGKEKQCRFCFTSGQI